MLILVSLDGIVLRSGNFHILHANSVDSVQAEPVQSTGLAHIGFLDFLGLSHDDLTAGFHLNTHIQVIGSLVDFLVLAAIPEGNAQLVEQLILGQHETVVTVGIADLVRSHERSEDSEQQHDGDNNESNNGSLVLSETLHCVLEISQTLGLQLVIVELALGGVEDELFT